jgi:hypothetical protein
VFLNTSSLNSHCFSRLSHTPYPIHSGVLEFFPLMANSIGTPYPPFPRPP